MYETAAVASTIAAPVMRSCLSGSLQVRMSSSRPEDAFGSTLGSVLFGIELILNTNIGASSLGTSFCVGSSGRDFANRSDGAGELDGAGVDEPGVEGVDSPGSGFNVKYSMFPGGHSSRCITFFVGSVVVGSGVGDGELGASVELGGEDAGELGGEDAVELGIKGDGEASVELGAEAVVELEVEEVVELGVEDEVGLVSTSSRFNILSPLWLEAVGLSDTGDKVVMASTSLASSGL